MRAVVLVVALLSLLSGTAFGQPLPMERFAADGTPPAEGKLHLWDLLSADPKSFPAIFERALTPQVEDFRGRRFDGMILLVLDGGLGKLIFTQYAGSNAALLSGKLYSQVLSFQKRFLERDNDRGESGVNYWPVRRAEALPMRIYLAPGILDEGVKASLMIDYDVPANKGVVQRPLVDEVRQIPGTELYLGKMYYRLGEVHVPFSWFALERRAEPASR